MIEIFDPDRIIPTPLTVQNSAGWHYPLDYQWILDTIEDITNPYDTNVLDVGASFSMLGTLLKRAGYTVMNVERSPDGLHDYKGDFLEVDFNGDKFDVVLWASSIEHQDTLEKYQACIDKSMELLAPGGVFMATFPVAISTVWYPQANQWNLSVIDAMRMYREDAVRGDYKKIWEKYRKNPYDMRSRYVARFGKWDIETPDYLAAGVIKINH